MGNALNVVYYESSAPAQLVFMVQSAWAKAAPNLSSQTAVIVAI